MTISVHYPKDIKGMDELQRRAAEIHADAVLRKINNLTCSKEQKLQLLTTIRNN